MVDTLCPGRYDVAEPSEWQRLLGRSDGSAAAYGLRSDRHLSTPGTLPIFRKRFRSQRKALCGYSASGKHSGGHDLTWWTARCLLRHRKYSLSSHAPTNRPFIPFNRRNSIAERQVKAPAIGFFTSSRSQVRKTSSVPHRVLAKRWTPVPRQFCAINYSFYGMFSCLQQWSVCTPFSYPLLLLMPKFVI